MQIALARIHAMVDIETGRICEMTVQISNDIVPQNGLLAKPTHYNLMLFLFSCTSGVAVNAIRSYLRRKPQPYITSGNRVLLWSPNEQGLSHI